MISPADLASVGLGLAPTPPRAVPAAPPSRPTPQEDKNVEVKLEPAPVEEVKVQIHLYTCVGVDMDRDWQPWSCGLTALLV